MHHPGAWAMLNGPFLVRPSAVSTTFQTPGCPCFLLFYSDGGNLSSTTQRPYPACDIFRGTLSCGTVDRCFYHFPLASCLRSFCIIFTTSFSWGTLSEESEESLVASDGGRVLLLPLYFPGAGLLRGTGVVPLTVLSGDDSDGHNLSCGGLWVCVIPTTRVSISLPMNARANAVSNVWVGRCCYAVSSESQNLHHVR